MTRTRGLRDSGLAPNSGQLASEKNETPHEDVWSDPSYGPILRRLQTLRQERNTLKMTSTASAAYGFPTDSHHEISLEEGKLDLKRVSIWCEDTRKLLSLDVSIFQPLTIRALTESTQIEARIISWIKEVQALRLRKTNQGVSNMTTGLLPPLLPREDLFCKRHTKVWSETPGSNAKFRIDVMSYIVSLARSSRAYRLRSDKRMQHDSPSTSASTKHSQKQRRSARIAEISSIPLAPSPIQRPRRRPARKARRVSPPRTHLSTSTVRYANGGIVLLRRSSRIRHLSRKFEHD
jgi:hypothetical protein